VDRRFFAWMLLTISLFMIWNSMNQRAALQKQEQELAAAERETKKLREAEKKREQAAAAIEKTDIGPAPTFPAAKYCLGSMDPQSGYRLLVTLTSQGAGVERVELVEQTKPGKMRYRSLAARGAYLGYLSPTPEAEGLRLRSIPPGSPAALATPTDGEGPAGLQVGDLLLQVDGLPLTSELELEKILSQRKPQAVAKLRVRREVNDGQPRDLELNAKLCECPLEIIRMQDDLPREEIPGNLLRPSLLTSLSAADGIEATPADESLPGLEASLTENWSMKPLDVDGGVGVEFALPLRSYLAASGINANLELVKRYRLQPASTPSSTGLTREEAAYHLDVETSVRNLDDVAHAVAFRQEGTNGLTLEAWWYAIKLSQNFFGTAGARDVMVARKSGPHELISRRTIQDYSKAHPDQPDNPFFGPDFPLDKRSFNYLGVDQQYFTTAILAHPQTPQALDDLAQGATRSVADLAKSLNYKDIGTNVSFWFDTGKETVAPRGELSRRYQVFAGPKDPTLLETYGLTGSLYFGWPIFEWVAKPLSVILHTFYSVVRNYGIAIIMLTILVRSCMFPLSRRAAIMGQRMQEMQPEMKRINELYKDDMNKRGQEIQALYKKYKLNPMASCLPVFIQIPIFIGLYRCVSTDIALRQQPLIPGLGWCSNLAGPDMLASFPSWMPDFIAGKGTGWFGPYLNLLPIITITLFIIQQKVLMPKATDEQTRMTQQMMMVMTVFMGVLFFKVPAGLCIYFITSSIWSLVERRLIKKFTPAMPLGAEVAAVSAPAIAPQNPRPKTNTKPPETIADVMDSLKNLWNQRRSSVDAKPPAVPPNARRKQRKKNP
jgi:YidC/Oxa1 family membrane protein insertase